MAPGMQGLLVQNLNLVTDRVLIEVCVDFLLFITYRLILVCIVVWPTWVLTDCRHAVHSIVDTGLCFCGNRLWLAYNAILRVIH
eukprot:XP_001707743.1 Hypothetical protein GL50803_38507 [Giardia lamblia ATCC 50803]